MGEVVIAGISVIGALVSVYYGHRLARASRLDEADALALRFREPLLQSAYNLQSRLYNIIRLSFLDKFLTAPRATPEEQEYSVKNTAYLVGQYLGWVEVIRRESQYMDPRSRAKNRDIVWRIEAVRETFADSIGISDPTFRLFRGEQRAIAEVMLAPATAGVPGVPRWECKGYASFVDDSESERFQRWFRRLEDDVMVVAKDSAEHLERLSALQHALVDLIDVLDPAGERIPLALRRRV